MPSSHVESKELREMARNIGNALAEGRIANPHRIWKLDPRVTLGKMWHGKRLATKVD